jgi:hypothetical protein
MKKNECLRLLLENVSSLPPRAKQEKSKKEKDTSMSLTRIMSTFAALSWAWIPSEMERVGKTTASSSEKPPRFTSIDGARAAVLRYAREKLVDLEPFKSAISEGVSDDILIGMISEKSTAFYLFWIFLDVQIRVRTYFFFFSFLFIFQNA